MFFIDHWELCLFTAVFIFLMIPKKKDKPEPKADEPSETETSSFREEASDWRTVAAQEDEDEQADDEEVDDEEEDEAPEAAAPEVLYTPVIHASAHDGKRRIRVNVPESLYAVARRELGDADHWEAILAANPGKIRNPAMLPVGLVLTLPAALNA